VQLSVGGCCLYCCVDSGTEATGIAQLSSPGCESTIVELYLSLGKQAHSYLVTEPRN